ncbi:hypothetical protein ABPG74_002938 [Tetrahymena malaccensis]
MNLKTKRLFEKKEGYIVKQIFRFRVLNISKEMIQISRNLIKGLVNNRKKQIISSLQQNQNIFACQFKQHNAPICYKPIYSFFWNKSNKEAENLDKNNTKNTAATSASAKPEKKDDDYFNPQSWDSLGFLMEQYKEASKNKKPLLPPQDPKYRGKLTVVLEMDEILFYTFVPDEHEAYINAPLKDHDYYFELPEYDTYLSVYKRPHLEEFLKYLRENTEPILFTKGVKSYAEKVLKLIDPENTFAHILTNEDCDKIIYPPEDMDEYVKDLERLNRDMKKVVYIDSQPISFWSAPDNALPVSSYYAELHDDDNQLKEIIDELNFLSTQDDVRTILSEEFKVRETLKQSRFL